MHRKRAVDLGDFEESQLVENETPNGKDRLSGLAEAEFVRYGRHTCWRGSDEKASIERLCISLPYVETFNSKVIKGFVPELRSRYVFFVFRDSYVLCIYVYEHSMYFSRIRISGCVTII